MVRDFAFERRHARSRQHHSSQRHDSGWHQSLCSTVMADTASAKPLLRRNVFPAVDQGGVYVVPISAAARIQPGVAPRRQPHRASRMSSMTFWPARSIDRPEIPPPAHLAISWEAATGLLMGAALTQRQDLFRAVVPKVGIYDMLRVELDPNGAFNIYRVRHRERSRPVQGALRLLALPSCERRHSVSGDPMPTGEGKRSPRQSDAIRER